jgi:hypothetical protein
VRIKQHVDFALFSDTLTAGELAQLIGLEPDRAMVRGSRREEPPRPAMHMWEIRCDDARMTVDAQIGRVIERLEPHRSALRQVVANVEDVTAELQVVRYFGGWLEDGEGEEEEITEIDGLTKLPGQHQLLGWHLSGHVLAFLLDVGAEIDFDEYG